MEALVDGDGTADHAEHEALDDAPALVNSSPEGDGWFFKMTVSDAGEHDKMMNEAEYKAFCEGLD